MSLPSCLLIPFFLLCRLSSVAKYHNRERGGYPRCKMRVMGREWEGGVKEQEEKRREAEKDTGKA